MAFKEKPEYEDPAYEKIHRRSGTLEFYRRERKQYLENKAIHETGFVDHFHLYGEPYYKAYLAELLEYERSRIKPDENAVREKFFSEKAKYEERKKAYENKITEYEAEYKAKKLSAKNDIVRQISNKEQIMINEKQEEEYWMKENARASANNAKKINRVNQLINEKAEVQKDGSLRISSEDWRGINQKLNEGNKVKNQLFEDAIRQIGKETQSESPPLERRNINSKEKSMSDENEVEKTGERDFHQEAFLNAAHQRKVISDAAKAGTLSCLPGENGYADTAPAVNLVNGTFYHGSTLLFLKEHQKENGFPSAEYLTADQIDKAQKANPDISVRKGQEGVSLYVREENAETGKWDDKHIRLFNVAQTTKPSVIKEWAAQIQQEKLQEKLAYLQSQYGTNYQPPEPKQRGPGPEIVCSSTEPEKYLGQYLAAVSMGGKFKASPEQAAEFSQKLEKVLYAKVLDKETGEPMLSKSKGEPFTDPFSILKVSKEASAICKETIIQQRMLAGKIDQPEQKQEQTQSRGRGM